MNIAVNTRFLLPGKMEGFGVYTHEIMQLMTRAHVEDTFDLYFDRPFSEKFAYSNRVRQHRVGLPARHPLLYYAWYQLALRRRLNKLGPDVFFSPDGYMPLGMNVPTVITIHDVSPMVFPEHISTWQRRYYHYYMPRFAAEASHIITVSEFSKREIIRHLDVNERKVSVVYNGVGRQFSDLAVTTHVREQYSGGKPYFLYVGAIHPRKNVANLLRAYELFRERSGLDIQLVVAGRSAWRNAEVEEVLAGMNYRPDVYMHGFVPASDLPALMREAQALVYVSLYEGFGIPLVEAMAVGTPVVTSSTGALAEIAGGAALLVDPLSVAAISSAMQEVLNTTTSDRLTGAGRKRARQFSWEVSASQTYDILKQHAKS